MIRVFILISVIMAGSLVGQALVWATESDTDQATDQSTEEEQQSAEDAEKAKEEAEKKEREKELNEDKDELEDELEEAEEKRDRSQAKLNLQRSILMKQRYALAQVQEDLESKGAEIEHTEDEIASARSRISLHKKSLAALVRALYAEHNTQALERVTRLGRGDSFSLVSDHVQDMRGRVVRVLGELTTEEKKLTEKKEELDEARAGKEVLEQEQKKKERSLAYATSIAQSEAATAAAAVSSLRAKLGNIQAKLSSLLGKGISTNDIEEAAEFATNQTGVRKEFLLGMLTVETDLGRFTGGCTYATSRMNERRKVAFKQITKELGHDYKEMRVSCPPSQYTGTGGAMGVAQFMSDTWLEYKDRIAASTGHNPPDPWNLVDGVMAMALKLANDGATTKSGEWNAAARYLGSCSGNTRFYCENVLYWAENYANR